MFRNGRSSIGDSSSSARFDRKAGPPPLGKADVQAARLEPAPLEQANGVVGIDAVGTSAVSDDLSAARQLGSKRIECRERRRSRTWPGTRAPAARRARRRRPAPASGEDLRPKAARPRPARPDTRPPTDSPLRRVGLRHRAPPPRGRPPARSQAGRRSASPPGAGEPGPPEREHAGAARCSRRSARSRSRSPRPSGRPARADRRSPPGGRSRAPAPRTRTRRTRPPSLRRLPHSQVIT